MRIGISHRSQPSQRRGLELLCLPRKIVRQRSSTRPKPPKRAAHARRRASRISRIPPRRPLTHEIHNEPEKQRRGEVFCRREGCEGAAIGQAEPGGGEDDHAGEGMRDIEPPVLKGEFAVIPLTQQPKHGPADQEGASERADEISDKGEHRSGQFRFMKRGIALTARPRASRLWTALGALYGNIGPGRASANSAVESWGGPAYSRWPIRSRFPSGSVR